MNIIYKILQIPGLVNVDFADVKAVMKNSGTAMLGVGVSSSKNRAQEAAEQATLAPLIGSSIESATGVVYNITGGKDITLQEVNKVSQVRIFPTPKREKYFILAAHPFIPSSILTIQLTLIFNIKKKVQLTDSRDCNMR